jgi:hypothetical protein
VVRELTAATQAYEGAKRSYNELCELYTVLEKAIATRSYKWKQFRGFTSSRAAMLFSNLVMKRGFQGKLEFQHDSTNVVADAATHGKLSIKVRQD